MLGGSRTEPAEGRVGAVGAPLRLGIMGGTYDPIHVGHLVTAEEARVQFGLDRIVFVPSARPPLKDPAAVTAPEHRYLMTLLATVGHPAFAVSRIEIERPGPSYAIDTIEELRRERPGAELSFITGADALLEILRGEWHAAERLLQRCRFIAAIRPGYALPPEGGRALPASVSVMEIPALAISSTDIRQRVRAGRPIRYLVPDAVEAYVRKYGLYREAVG